MLAASSLTCFRLLLAGGDMCCHTLVSPEVCLQGGQFGARLGGQPVQAQPQRQPSQGGGSESAFGGGVMLRQPGARTEEERQQLMREAALQQRMVGQGAAAKVRQVVSDVNVVSLPLVRSDSSPCSRPRCSNA